MIVWSEDLRIGHPIIDGDHQKLISIINEFFARQGKEDERQILNDTLRSLFDYAHQHFERERKIQQEAMYPYIEMHAIEHKYFLNQVKELASVYFIKKVKSLDSKALEDVRRLLGHWLIDHIKKFDINMREWVQLATPE